MFDLLSSLLTGGALGGLFAFAQQGFKLWERKQQQKHDLAMREQDRLDTEQEHKLGMERIQSEGAIARDLAETEGATARAIAATKAHSANLQASYANDRATYGGGWVDSFRGFTRPGLTWELVTSMIVLAFTGLFMLDALTRQELIIDLLPVIINSMMVATTTALNWWFAGRMMSKGA